MSNAPNNARKALVTGAAQGIGRGIALALARQGTHVVVHARTEAQAQATLNLIQDAGGQASAWTSDLCDITSAPPEGIDILVHNASAFAKFGTLETVASHEIQAVLEVVLSAGMQLASMVLPGMRTRGWGRFVFVGSAAGHLGAAGQVAYATAKAGLVGLTRSLALEAGPSGVTSNLVEPGLVSTERTRRLVSKPMWKAIADRTALGRSGSVEDVASLVAFLAGDEAGFMTGAVIPVDGGLGLGVGSLPSEDPER